MLLRPDPIDEGAHSSEHCEKLCAAISLPPAHDSSQEEPANLNLNGIVVCRGFLLFASDIHKAGWIGWAHF